MFEHCYQNLDVSLHNLRLPTQLGKFGDVITANCSFLIKQWFETIGFPSSTTTIIIITDKNSGTMIGNFL